MSRYKYILFDLDGTLTDSGEGIINSVVYALKKRKIEVTDRAALRAFVGPPLLDSFAQYYGMDREEGMKAIADYREYFTDRGWKENSVYPGIPQVLGQLKAAGAQLYIATSKPEPFAKRIAEYFDLAQYFDGIVGSTLDEKITKKSQVIDLVLSQIGKDYQGKTIMVGDREHDVNGAKENGLPCIGVLYGYGSREELENAGAVGISATVEGLPAELL
mgnify:CR=1 FL=1